jgi:glycosyltransferase involved in cell wall biosynthesis
MIPYKPKLSVITVVYNNARDIERTILSVLTQTYSEIEYIVIDGLSTDGTLRYINRYRNLITKVVSEKDEGIYDAMNKGLALTTGDYVIFMNSGDEFYDNDTVEKVFATEPDADIYYGETEMINEQGEILGRRRHQAPDHLDFYSFKYGMTVSHQAIYIKKFLAEPFDRRYVLSADIDWIMRAIMSAKKTVKVDGYVARYLVGGMSKARHRKSLVERFDIMRRYYGLFPTIANHLVIAYNLGKYWLKHKRTND